MSSFTVRVSLALLMPTICLSQHGVCPGFADSCQTDADCQAKGCKECQQRGGLFGPFCSDGVEKTTATQVGNWSKVCHSVLDGGKFCQTWGGDACDWKALYPGSCADAGYEYCCSYSPLPTYMDKWQKTKCAYPALGPCTGHYTQQVTAEQTNGAAVAEGAAKVPAASHAASVDSQATQVGNWSKVCHFVLDGGAFCQTRTRTVHDWEACDWEGMYPGSCADSGWTYCCSYMNKWQTSVEDKWQKTKCAPPSLGPCKPHQQVTAEQTNGAAVAEGAAKVPAASHAASVDSQGWCIAEFEACDPDAWQPWAQCCQPGGPVGTLKCCNAGDDEWVCASASGGICNSGQTKVAAVAEMMV